MNNIIKYKDYIGSVEFSEEDNLLFGRLLGIRALVTYEGNTIKELVEDFHTAVDDYLALCEGENITPEHPYKGSFNVRISPETHRSAAIYAINHGISLNHFVEECISQKLSGISF